MVWLVPFFLTIKLDIFRKVMGQYQFSGYSVVNQGNYCIQPPGGSIGKGIERPFIVLNCDLPWFCHAYLGFWMSLQLSCKQQTLRSLFDYFQVILTFFLRGGRSCTATQVHIKVDFIDHLGQRCPSLHTLFKIVCFSASLIILTLITYILVRERAALNVQV